MKEIFNDWKGAFPLLYKVKPFTLYEILGPLLLGIELEKSRFSECYRPYLSVSGLWGSDVSNFKGKLKDFDCAFYPEIYFPLNNSLKIRDTYFVDYEEHKALFSQMIAEIKNQFPPLEKNVKKEELLNFINWYRNNNDLIKGGSNLDAQLLEFRYILGLYFNDYDLIANTEKEIDNEREKWDKRIFVLKFGDYNEWLNKIKTLQRQDLLNSILRVTNNEKLRNLNVYELI